MKRFALALFFSLLSTLVHAQCSGPFPNNYVCGNVSGSTSTAAPIPFASFPVGLTVGSTTIASGTTTAPLFNNAGVLGNGLITSTWSTFTQVGTGATLRTVQSKLTDTVSLLDFGGDPTGVANSTTALSNALATGKAVYAPKGTYLLTGTCPTISTIGQRLFGDGFAATIFSSTCTLGTINIADAATHVQIQDIKLIRTGGAATVGQDGIRCAIICDYARIDNVWVETHYNGFRLSGASFNQLSNSVANNNQLHGIYITNSSGCAGLQWTLINNLSQQNNGDGYRLEASTCSASVGEMLNNSSYANKLRGVAVLGTSGAIALQGPRILGGFFGQDCSHEIYLDTYASTTSKIQGTFLELAGTSACGVNQSTSATNVGNGLNATANNAAIVVEGNVVIQNSYSGISVNATRSQIVGNNMRLNGAALVGGELAGISINAGNATVTGNSSKGQSIGLSVTVDTVIAVGNDFSENSLAPIVSGVNLIASDVCNNYPTAAAMSCPLTATGIGNTATTIDQYVDIIYTNAAFTTTRTWTLPAANAVRAGKRIQVQDWQGTVTPTNTLVVARAGSDTINGGTAVTITGAFSNVTLTSDGVSKWTTTMADIGTAWTAYTPTITCGTNTLTSGTATGRFRTIGKTVFLEASLAITTNGTCATSLRFSLPAGVVAASASPIVGNDFTGGLTLFAGINSAASLVTVLTVAGAYPGADGKNIVIGGTFEQQ